MSSDVIFRSTTSANLNQRVCQAHEDIFFCTEEETCCENGCCTSVNNKLSLYLWGLFFGTIFLMVLMYYYAVTKCKTKTNNDSFRTNNEISSYHYDNCVITSPESYQNAGSSYPITPPPVYEMALSAPFRYPNDKIPSYEDVMSGKNTSKTLWTTFRKI
ncbi:uncharacterized protein LOC135125027 [Zophobas morio]|uniref:uncharacterized protein LOC135125027 n=1 Tax=Zophobas morio TaxID=2755281 RepID=UPI003083BCC0